MIELPESHVLARQIAETVVGRRIQSAVAGASPHKWAWYTGDPDTYNGLLSGQTIVSAGADTGYTCGGNVEIRTQDRMLVLSTLIRYHAPGEKITGKHQLLLTLDDGSALRCAVQMWGALYCLPLADLPPRNPQADKPSPLSAGFTRAYFDGLLTDENQSVKAFLATEQRIPGLGNGVVQDILWNARLHPRRRMATLTANDRDALYRSVVDTLRAMTDEGGRDTEKDLFDRPGGYATVLSAGTMTRPCPACGGPIRREAYLGGNVYFCPVCQPLLPEWK